MNGSLFDGPVLDSELDDGRLLKQIERVYSVMQSGAWWSLSNIGSATGFPEASISARLRDLRKPWWGGHDVTRRRVGDSGLYEYRLVTSEAGLLDGVEAGHPSARQWRDYEPGAYCVAHKDFHARRPTRRYDGDTLGCDPADWRNIRIKAEGDIW